MKKTKNYQQAHDALKYNFQLGNRTLDAFITFVTLNISISFSIELKRFSFKNTKFDKNDVNFRSIRGNKKKIIIV